MFLRSQRENRLIGCSIIEKDDGQIIFKTYAVPVTRTQSVINFTVNHFRNNLREKDVEFSGDYNYLYIMLGFALISRNPEFFEDLRGLLLGTTFECFPNIDRNIVFDFSNGFGEHKIRMDLVDKITYINPEFHPLALLNNLDPENKSDYEIEEYIIEYEDDFEDKDIEEHKKLGGPCGPLDDENILRTVYHMFCDETDFYALILNYLQDLEMFNKENYKHSEKEEKIPDECITNFLDKLRKVSFDTFEHVIRELVSSSSTKYYIILKAAIPVFARMTDEKNIPEVMGVWEEAFNKLLTHFKP